MIIATRAGEGYVEEIRRRDDGLFDINVSCDCCDDFTETVDLDGLQEYVRTAVNRFKWRVIAAVAAG